MNKINLGLIFMFLVLSGFKSDKPAYIVYDKEGNEASYSEIIDKAIEADIVFFGELHNDPIAHWLELEISRDLYKKGDKELIMGAEMFERDDQLIIDEYLDGMYASSKFENEVKLWRNYKTDYKPLVEFARENDLPFIATNIPRRYASMVSRSGFEVLDSISNRAKKYVAPLPPLYDENLKGYKDMLTMGGRMHGNSNLPKAQAIKDATMAYSILENWNTGQLFIHFNGSYHSRNFEGIIWYLLEANPDLNIVSIETVRQDDITKLKEANTGIASFVISIPENMTSTYISN